MSEFLYCILAVFLIGLICSLIIHRAHRAESREPGAARRLGAESRRLREARKAALHQHSHDKERWVKRDQTLRKTRELHAVRTPWGWPQPFADKNKRKRRSGLSKLMNSITGRMPGKNKRLQSPAGEIHPVESVRVMLEERYFTSNWNSPKEIEYRKVKAPLLRDPNAPHDQMDNFGIKQAELVRKKAQRLAKVKVDVEAAAARKEDLRYVDLKDIKQPWGW